MSGSSLAIDVSKVSGDGRVSKEDTVAVEEPLEIQLTCPSAGGAAAKSVSITMRTPGDDAELAAGFLFTEGIIQVGHQVASVEHCGAPAPESGLRNIIRVDLKPGIEVDLDRLKRHFYTTSSCGVCGKASLDALRVTGQKSLADNTVTFRRKVIVKLPDKLIAKQQVFTKTGGLHAAAVFDADGQILFVKEDVGRHNAVDKIVGTLLMSDMLPANDLGLIVSGRASFELMQKALVAGIPLLAAVSAPSSLAVRLAQEFDMTLIGFLREGNFNIYSGEQRVI
ncbi:MAG: formate dehydrogenase accessory sulfurtransferase FdhD [Woeseia sp.]